MTFQRSSSALFRCITRVSEREALAKYLGTSFRQTGCSLRSGPLRNHEQFVGLSTSSYILHKDWSSIYQSVNYSTNTSNRQSSPPLDSKLESVDKPKVEKIGDDIGYKTAEDKAKVSKTGDGTGDKTTEDEVDESQLTVFQRFKKAYKEHGKVLIGVHLVTSSVWFGSFYYAAHVGVDVIPLMEYIGFSDRIINPFRNSSVGDVALAYLMYKLATPARYTVTLAGTNFMIKYLRKTGKMEPKQENLRELMKDGRHEVREKKEQIQVKFKERQSERQKHSRPKQ